MTMLHPFVEPEALNAEVRRGVADVAARHPPFDYTLSKLGAWPDAIYVVVDPAEPFARLHRDLQAAFPEYPIYEAGPGFEFVPHVTVADRQGRLQPGVEEDEGWRALPRPSRASALDVIVKGDDGRWSRVWRIPLGGGLADRIRP